MILRVDQPSSSALSACQNPKQTDLIGRYVHSLLLQKENCMAFLQLPESDIGFVLSRCASLRNLSFPEYVDAEMVFNLLNEHASPTLRRIRIKWCRSPRLFTLSTIPQTTLQNLTHLELWMIDVLSYDELYWDPLRSTSLQYLSLQWLDYLREEHISAIEATFSQRPLSLKALIPVLDYESSHNQSILDELDVWFCENQNDSKDGVVILGGLTSRTIDNGMQPVIGLDAGDSWHHKVWNRWGFLTPSPYSGGCYDLCEELLPDGKLTIWERADRGLEERRLRLASQERSSARTMEKLH
jgi:hypothetical protein